MLALQNIQTVKHCIFLDRDVQPVLLWDRIRGRIDKGKGIITSSFRCLSETQMEIIVCWLYESKLRRAVRAKQVNLEVGSIPTFHIASKLIIKTSKFQMKTSETYERKTAKGKAKIYFWINFVNVNCYILKVVLTLIM